MSGDLWWVWMLLGMAVLSVAAVCLVRAVRRRRLPGVLGGVRVEVVEPHVDADHVLEVEWSVPVVFTNNTRRPRSIPILGERALVRAGRATYNALFYVDEDVLEASGAVLQLNPAGTLTGRVKVLLPAGAAPSGVRFAQFSPYTFDLRGPVPASGPTSTLPESTGLANDASDGVVR